MSTAAEEDKPMDAAPHCILCSVKRNLISVSPGVGEGEIRAFECPQCNTVLRLVVQRDRDLPAAVSGSHRSIATRSCKPSIDAC